MMKTKEGVLRQMAQELTGLADEKSENARRLDSLELRHLASREWERCLTLRAAATELLLMIGEGSNDS